jgi:hypothetical protein
MTGPRAHRLGMAAMTIIPISMITMGIIIITGIPIN